MLKLIKEFSLYVHIYIYMYIQALWSSKHCLWRGLYKSIKTSMVNPLKQLHVGRQEPFDVILSFILKIFKLCPISQQGDDKIWKIEAGPARRNQESMLPRVDVGLKQPTTFLLQLSAGSTL